MVVPAGTIPNATLPGVAVNAAVTPVPLNGYCATLFVALLVMLSDPVTTPAVVGANFTETFTLAPTAKVLGIVRPETLIPAPVTDSPEMATLAAPVFVTVTEILALDPTPTLPKLCNAGVKVRVPFVTRTCALAFVLPCTPSRNNAATNATRQGFLMKIRIGQ